MPNVSMPPKRIRPIVTNSLLAINIVVLVALLFELDTGKRAVVDHLSCRASPGTPLVPTAPPSLPHKDEPHHEPEVAAQPVPVPRAAAIHSVVPAIEFKTMPTIRAATVKPDNQQVDAITLLAE